MILGEFAITCSGRSILFIDELYHLETGGYLLQDLLASIRRGDLSGDMDTCGFRLVLADD